MTDESESESTVVTIESNAETTPADDLEIDLEDADDPLNDLRVALAKREKPAWNVTTIVEIDTETAERYRPAFEQAVTDPDESFHDLVNNYAATDVQLTIHGYDPEYYFEHRSEDVRDHWLTMDIMDALRDADEPLDWDELVAATGIDEATLDSKIMALQDRDIVRVRGREPHGYILVNKEDRGNNDV